MLQAFQSFNKAYKVRVILGSETMIQSFTARLAIVATILGLAACAELGQGDNGATKGSAHSKFSKLALVVNGKSIDALTPSGIGAELRKVDIDIGKKAEVKAWQQAIRQGTADKGMVPPALTGISGFTTIQLVDVALAEGAERQIVSGKIRDYIFDKSTGSGHLAVDTKVEFYNTLTSFNSSVPDRIEQYHWDIEVEGGFEVQPHSGNDLDPFPGSVEFTDKTLKAIKKRGMKFKLFAQGKSIKVRHIYRRVDGGPLARLKASHPYYVSTEESCIDLMFDRYPPATELPPQIGYCLGRCDHPQIINTK